MTTTEVEIAALDHIYLTVSDFRRAEQFYDRVTMFLGFKKGTAPINGEPHVHYFNRAMQLSIRPARTHASHDPYAPGLHHLFQAVRRPFFSSPPILPGGED